MSVKTQEWKSNRVSVPKWALVKTRQVHSTLKQDGIHKLIKDSMAMICIWREDYLS